MKNIAVELQVMYSYTGQSDIVSKNDQLLYILGNLYSS